MIKNITVNNLDGAKVNLIKEYKGKPLLLIFYNNKCLGCTGRAIPLAYRYQQEYCTLQVIGIHSNFGGEKVSKEEIKNIFTRKELPFPIYIDENHKVYDNFNCEGTPQWILLTSNGEVLRSIFGSQLGVQNRLLYALEELILKL